MYVDIYERLDEAVLFPSASPPARGRLWDRTGPKLVESDDGVVPVGAVSKCNEKLQEEEQDERHEVAEKEESTVGPIFIDKKSEVLRLLLLLL